MVDNDLARFLLLFSIVLVLVLAAWVGRRSFLDNGGGRAPDHRRGVSAGIGTVEVGAMAGKMERTTGTVGQWRNEGIGVDDDDGS